MKIIALPVVLLFATSLLSAETPAPATPAPVAPMPVAPAAPAPAAPAPTEPAAAPRVMPSKSAKPIEVVNPAIVKPAPVAPSLTAKTPLKKEVKKEEAMGKITGVEIARANGTWLGLDVVGGNFVLSFYNAKKKPMAPDVSRATARWPNPRSALGPNQTVLNASGNAFVGSKPVLPPFTFIVRLTLLKGEGDSAVAVENYTVQYH